jgi:hypothetical protein
MPPFFGYHIPSFSFPGVPPGQLFGQVVAESAVGPATQMAAPDGSNWCRPWLGWLIQLRNDASIALSKPVAGQAVAQIARPAEEQLNQASARFDSWREQLVNIGVDEQTTAAAGELLADTQPREVGSAWGHSQYCVTDGALDRLTVYQPVHDPGSRLGGTMETLAIVVLAVGAVLLAQRTGANDLLYKWPQTTGFLIGIAWWAWLRPSWFGLAIAAASAMLALHSGWPGRAIRMDASTVLRTSRPK